MKTIPDTKSVVLKPNLSPTRRSQLLRKYFENAQAIANILEAKKRRC